MKEKMLRNLWLRVAIIMAVLTTAFAGTTWAEIHPITVEREGFTAIPGQIDGNISYLTSSNGSCSSAGVLSAKTITLTASNGAKICTVAFHCPGSYAEIGWVATNHDNPEYNNDGTFVANAFSGNINEEYPIVTGLNCDEIVFRNINNGTDPSFDDIKVTYTPGALDNVTITYQPNDPSKGTVELDGNVIIAKPNPCYGVDDNNPCTVTVGNVTWTPNTNYFVVDPSTACDVTINFAAHAGGSSLNFEHNLDSYTDWVHGGTIVRSQNYQIENAHGGKYYGITNATKAWMKTATPIQYPGTFTCYVRRTQNQESLTWKIQWSSTGSDSDSDWKGVKEYSPAGTVATSWEEFSADLSEYTNVYVRLLYTGNGTAGAIDDIVLTEGAVPVFVSSSGLSTFCCHRALDFTESNIKVYYATASGTSLTFTRIKKLPANTGVLLQMDGGGTEDVPALIGTADAVPSTNVFVPGPGPDTDGKVSYSNDNQNYILHDGKFYKANGNIVEDNHAYIHLPTGSNVKDFTINLDDDDETGIETIDARPTANDAIYNLAGQRLKKLQKGINIVNGKKVIQR